MEFLAELGQKLDRVGVVDCMASGDLELSV